ncbi:MAG: YHS domain-containing (seleno)protein [Myxococcaceae bacterium]
MKSLPVLVLALAALPALADGSKIQLGGYCPVAYLNAGKALPGDAKVTSEVDGKTYYLVNEATKKVFDAEPKKFTNAIQYQAWCATGLAMGKKIATDPALFSVLDGKVYFFSSKGAKDTFDKMPKDFVTKADAQAKKLLVD